MLEGTTTLIGYGQCWDVKRVSSFKSQSQDGLDGHDVQTSNLTLTLTLTFPRSTCKGKGSCHIKNISKHSQQDSEITKGGQELTHIDDLCCIMAII